MIYFAYKSQLILTKKYLLFKGDRPFCCPMPNCRRRFATEPEVKKHIDNHMNPHAAKSRRLGPMGSNNDTKPSFLSSMDKQTNLIPRMGPVVKHELYFPQCYAPPFNQAFGGGGGGGVQQQTHGTPATPVPSVPPPTVVQ